MIKEKNFKDDILLDIKRAECIDDDSLDDAEYLEIPDGDDDVIKEESSDKNAANGRKSAKNKVFPPAAAMSEVLRHCAALQIPVFICINSPLQKAEWQKQFTDDFVKKSIDIIDSIEHISLNELHGEERCIVAVKEVLQAFVDECRKEDTGYFYCAIFGKKIVSDTAFARDFITNEKGTHIWRPEFFSSGLFQKSKNGPHRDPIKEIIMMRAGLKKEPAVLYLEDLL